MEEVIEKNNAIHNKMFWAPDIIWEEEAHPSDLIKYDLKREFLMVLQKVNRFHYMSMCGNQIEKMSITFVRGWGKEC